MADLEKVFAQELNDMHDGETQLVDALPKLAELASSQELRDALTTHLEETRGQVQRLEQIFTSLGEAQTTKKCKGIEGLLEEGREAAKELPKGATRDAVLIAGSQKIEHYEIATYGTLRAWAEELGHDEAARLLNETLEEESAANEKLNAIAEAGINEAASA